MTPPAADLARYRATAVQLAEAAGVELLQFALQRERLGTTSKGHRRELVTLADRAAEGIVVDGLLQQYPEHGILAEEGVRTAAGRASNDNELLWIIDPLDGTTNFVHGLPFYAVAIALAWRGEVVAAAVHAPALGRTFSAAAGAGATCNGMPLSVSTTPALADALLATGFSYVRNEPGRDDNSGKLARVLPLCRDLRRFGSAELDLCLVGSGQFDGYWELYLAPYDVAAGALVVREAGGRVTDLRGGDGWLYGGQVLASNGALHEPLLAVLQ